MERDEKDKGNKEESYELNRRTMKGLFEDFCKENNVSLRSVSRRTHKLSTAMCSTWT